MLSKKKPTVDDFIQAAPLHDAPLHDAPGVKVIKEKSFLLRMDPALHHAAKAAALEKGVTMQEYIIQAIAFRVASK